MLKTGDRWDSRFTELEARCMSHFGAEVWTGQILPQVKIAAQERGLTDLDLFGLGPEEAFIEIRDLASRGREILLERSVNEAQKQAQAAGAEEKVRQDKRQQLEVKMRDRRYCGTDIERDPAFIREIEAGFAELHPASKDAVPGKPSGLLTGE